MNSLNDGIVRVFSCLGDYLRAIPGMTIVVDYIERSYQHDPIRLLLEALLLIFALNYVFYREKKKTDVEKLTEAEIQELVTEWKPEPLVPCPVDQQEDEDVPLIKGEVNLNVTLTTGEILQNWSLHNFLGLQNSQDATKAAIETVRGCGVGTCGPPGFYGSMDIHLNLEKELAQTFKVDEAIIYSQALMAVSSVIPAFSKRGDYIVADEGVSIAGLIGLEISRSNIKFFKHNDMADLERVLQDVDEEFKRKKIPLTRRFILVEGLYANYGDKCPLPQIIELKKKYKYRLIVDECLSFACLGPHGLGISDFYGIPASEIDIITGAFCNGLGSSGGFCAGSRAVIDHQRLSSQAYCFSAALPPLFASAVSVALQQLQNNPEIYESLRRNILAFNDALSKKVPSNFVIIGDKDSPLRFIQFAERKECRSVELKALKEITMGLRKRGYLVAIPKFVDSREKVLPPPSIKICISAGFTQEQTRMFAEKLLSCLKDRDSEGQEI